MAGTLPALGAAGASGGLTLLEAPGARAAAMGEAFSTMPDDVSAAVYNPAALATLTRGQTSLSYESGLADDSYGRVDAGIPGFGISAGYYSAGNVDLFENGVTRTVDAQKDLVLSVGAARVYQDMTCYGGAIKYLSSQLAETSAATAWALDAGVLHTRGRFTYGGAIQNIGTKLTYESAGDPLPRIVRGGVRFRTVYRTVPIYVLGELPYFVNEAELRPGLGVEARTGPLSFRAGYRTGTELQGLSLGMGFAVGDLRLDYAFGFVETLSATQRVSLVFKFLEPSRAGFGDGLPVPQRPYSSPAGTDAAPKKAAPAAGGPAPVQKAAPVAPTTEEPVVETAPPPPAAGDDGPSFFGTSTFSNESNDAPAPVQKRPRLGDGE